MTLPEDLSFDPEHDGCIRTCAGSPDGEICGEFSEGIYLSPTVENTLGCAVRNRLCLRDWVLLCMFITYGLSTEPYNIHGGPVVRQYCRVVYPMFLREENRQATSASTGIMLRL